MSELETALRTALKHAKIEERDNLNWGDDEKLSMRIRHKIEEALLLLEARYRGHVVPHEDMIP